MKRLFGIFLIWFALVGCMSMGDIVGNSQFDDDYKIEAIFGENRFVVSFDSYEFMCKQEEIKASAELRPANFEKIEEVHYIIYRTMDWERTFANPKNWTIIVTDANNQELFRGNGADEFPKANIGEYAITYSAYGVIPVNRDVLFPISIRAINMSNDIITTTISKK
jgi:hypothetical protein